MKTAPKKEEVKSAESIALDESSEEL